MKTFEIIYYSRPGRTESHRYTESWATTQWHCPSCGQKQVWENQGGGDYYVGCKLICIACAFSFYMPSARAIKDHESSDDSDVQRLAQLQSP